MKRRIMWSMALSVFLVLAACGLDADDKEDSLINEEEPAVENEEENQEAPAEDEKTEESEEKTTDTEDKAENTEGDKVTETGVYNGQADPHTIEIETEEGPVAFQLTKKARDDIENITEGEEVTYTYYKDGEQLVIESIYPFND